MIYQKYGMLIALFLNKIEKQINDLLLPLFIVEAIERSADGSD